jgi:hypothetical protein
MHYLPSVKRPVTFECPWCGPNGVEVDFTLPVSLRLCDRCHEAANTVAEPASAVRVEDLAVTQLRDILRKHLAEWGQRWHGAEFAKGIIGNSILGALESYGCDPKTELQAAIADTGFRHA